MSDDAVRILLIDDDEDDFVLVRDLLAEIPHPRYEAHWCSGYAQALECLGSPGFAAAICDYRLGEQNGIDLIREAIGRGADLPIVLLTGQGDHEIDLAAMEAGAADFLDKAQLSPGLLERSLRYAVHSHGVERQREQLLRVAERQAAQLRYLANELTKAEHRERRRVAQTLHDHLQQLLVAAKMRVDRLGLMMSAESRLQAIKPLAQIQQLLSDSIEASRSLTVQLSPPVLHDRGLVPALEWLSRSFGKEHNLDVQVIARDAVEIGDDNVRDFLFQAVRELLFNVVKHAKTDRAEIEAVIEDGSVVVSVQDYGDGCDSTHITDPPQQEGFGLFHVQQRVGFLGGRFDVESEPGEGCRITLTVPQRDAEETARAAGVVEAQPRAGTTPVRSEGSRGGEAIRVLLVDDHKILREGIAGLLQDEPDISVVGEAADGEEAVRLAKQLRPDVVVMDVSLPIMSGIEATRQITAELPGVKVIGLSMHEKDDMAAAMREAGAVAYLPKGGPSGDLITALFAVARPAPIEPVGR